MRSFATIASALAVLAPLASAQTFTECNPMESACYLLHSYFLRLTLMQRIALMMLV